MKGCSTTAPSDGGGRLSAGRGVDAPADRQHRAGTRRAQWRAPQAAVTGTVHGFRVQTAFGRARTPSSRHARKARSTRASPSPRACRASRCRGAARARRSRARAAPPAPPARARRRRARRRRSGPRRARRRAPRSSTTAPRAVFTSTAVGFIAASAAASIRWCVLGRQRAVQADDVRLGEQRLERVGPAGEDAPSRRRPRRGAPSRARSGRGRPRRSACRRGSRRA